MMTGGVNFCHTFSFIVKIIIIIMTKKRKQECLKENDV